MMTLAVSQWTQTPLEELFDFVIGGDWGKDPEYDDNLYAEALCIRGSEFRFWKSEKGKTAVLRKVKKSSLESRKLRLGDILIEISGGGPDQPVGRTVHIDQDVISFSTKPLICTNFLRLARPTDLVNSAFLNYFLTYFYKTGEVVNYQSGSNNLRNLQFKDYIKIPVPLPPQAEQTRIVEKLDEVLAQVDTIKARLDGIPAILKRFRQSVLAAAVSGRLTEEWRKTHDSKVELDGVLNDAVVARSNKGFKAPKGIIEIDEIPFEIPSGWLWIRLGDICLKITDGAHNTPKVLEKGFPYLMAKDLTGGKLDFSQQQFISESDHTELYKKCNPERGDLLVVNIGAGTGNNVLVDVDFEFSFKNIAILKRSNAITPTYLKSYFDSQKKKIFDEQTRGGAQPFLSLTILNNILIGLPSIDEQEEISRLVSEYFAFIDTIEAQVKKAQARVDNLTQSILAKAFRGELVVQDPSDEPAEKLLERIAQARKEAEALAKAAKKVAKTK